MQQTKSKNEIPKDAQAPLKVADFASPNITKDNANAHATTFSNVFINDIAEKAMFDFTVRPFPVGSVIVREKLASDDSDKPDVLTVMVKREKGFNQENGDWEFLVLDGGVTKIQQREKVGSCQACHAQKKERDFVFHDYFARKILK